MKKMFLNKKNLLRSNYYALRTAILLTCLFTTYVFPQNTVEVTSGNTIELLNGNQMEISGSYSDVGTFTTDNSSTVIFNGTANCTITKTGGENFTNLTVNQLSGVLTLNNNATVTGVLTITSGSLITGSNTVTLGGSATITEASGSTVTGNLTTTRTLLQNVNNTFGGIGVEINAASAAPGATTVTRVTGTAEKNDSSSSVKRYFDIVPSTDSGLNATFVFHYDVSDLNGLNEPTLQLFISTDRGSTWAGLNGTVNASAHTITINGINSFSRSTLFGINNVGQIVWEKTNGPHSYHIYSLAVGANNILYAGTSSGGVYSTTDEGNTWTSISSAFQSFDVRSLCFNPSGEFFAGTFGGGVYKSIDGGTNWSAINGSGSSQLTDLNVYAVAALENNVILAGTNGDGIFTSTDDGSTWNQTLVTSNGLVVNTFMSDKNGNIYAGTNGTNSGSNGVDLSADNGSSWTSTGLANINVVSLTLGLYNKLFAGSGYGEGIFSSSDQGKTWVSPVLNSNNILALTMNQSGTLFAGTEANGVYASIDNGANWIQVNNNLTDPDILSLAVNNSGVLFAGTDQDGVFRAGSAPTAVKNIHSNLPTSYTLSQNYPNPFNPTTMINYQLSRNSYVTLKVYDLLGREVATLVNKQQSAGSYSVTFAAGNLASGIYFYQLIAGGFNQVKKLVLLK
ncbi:MAG: T9SS type A sorting domain-containing protein [Ignavibacteriaceae bacterium]